MVELELFQRRERLVALLGQRKPLPGLGRELVEPVVGGCGLAQERPSHEDDDGDREHRRDGERQAHQRTLDSRWSRARRVPRGKSPLLDRVGPHRDQGAGHEEEARGPDEVDQRLHQHLEVDRAVRPFRMPGWAVVKTSPSERGSW